MKNVNGWMFPNLDTHLSNHVGVYPKTLYQQETINKALKLVSKNDLAVDIGANVGLHSRRFADSFKSVISFEPTTSNFECLIENTKELKNITLHKIALGNSRDVMNISIPKDADNCGLYSLVDFRNRLDIDNEKIEVTTLDSFSIFPDLIKIDTQGFELEVLYGAEKTLVKSNPVLITEIETKKEKNKILSFLSNLGYELVDEHRKDKIWIKK